MASKSGGGLKPGLAKRGALFPEGRGLGVGGRRGRKKEKGEGRAPADLHPPLNKKIGLGYLFLLADEDAAGVSWIAAVEGEQQI